MLLHALLCDLCGFSLEPSALNSFRFFAGLANDPDFTLFNSEVLFEGGDGSFYETFLNVGVQELFLPWVAGVRVFESDPRHAPVDVGHARIPQGSQERRAFPFLCIVTVVAQIALGGRMTEVG